MASGLVLPITSGAFGYWYADGINAAFFVAPVHLVLIEWFIRDWGLRLLGSVLELASLCAAGLFIAVIMVWGMPRLIGAYVALVAIPLHGILTVVFAVWCCVVLYRGEPAA